MNKTTPDWAQEAAEKVIRSVVGFPSITNGSKDLAKEFAKRLRKEYQRSLTIVFEMDTHSCEAMPEEYVNVDDLMAKLQKNRTRKGR
jgi:hypothetical protein